MTPPAISLPLSGHALIEASAGTGKTWTLTGILLRLLLEGGHEPRHIVATTFTRAAATEMQRRVHARVEHYRHLLVSIIRAHGQDPDLLQENDELIPRVLALLDSSDNPTTREQAADAVNRHLLHHALSAGVNGLILAYRRCLLALQSLDQLFVGTLDSLCQRWLRELALESGIADIRINPDSDAIAQLSHDHLRHYYQTQAQENRPRFADFYAQAPHSDRYTANSRTTLNYGDAPFLPLPPLAADNNDVNPAALLADFTADDINAAQHLLHTLLAKKRLSGASKLARNAAALGDALQQLRQQTADSHQHPFLQGLHDAFAAADEGGNPFNKSASAEERRSLIANPLLNAMQQAAAALAQKAHNLKLLALHSLQDNSEYVRRHLPEALRHSGETTYSELLARLNATLSANPALAEHLAHRYPVMLVDEAQDLNHEQAQLLRSIYTLPAHQGFWLLVGDPKQAIYRFRGSDVENYNALKALIGPPQALTLNFRSAPALIDALNACYDSHPDNGDLGTNIRYQNMEAAHSERPLCQRDGSPIAAPLQWLAIDKADDEPAALVELVRHLTSRDSRWLRRGKNGLLPLKQRDIMILARSNSALQKLEDAFAQAGIASERDSKQSLFAQSVAREMAWLLAAIVEPGNSALVRRLLSGKFYGLDIATLDALAGSDILARFHQQLARARSRWHSSGLLAALQDLWREDPWGEADDNLWTRLAAQPEPDCWRDLLDLRRLQEIIAEHAQPPERFLAWWQAQIAAPPTAEWAHCLPLPGSDSVRLMTIHKAKGLQAPVVILAGMSNSQKPKPYDIHAYHDHGQLTLATGDHNADANAHIQAENDAEARRLLYVSLTRAEDLLFIASRQHSLFAPLKALRDSAGMTAEPLPVLIAADTQAVNWDTPPPPAPLTVNTPLPAPARRGWRKTSFSALARDIPDASLDLAVHAALDLELAQEILTPPAAGAAIASAFPRGVQAGSFLHEALEKIRHRRRAHWPVFFRTLLAKHHLSAEEEHIPALEQWFAHILASRLSSGTNLVELENHDAPIERELGFSLALNAARPLPVDALNRHFAAWGKALTLPDSHALYRYLRGEIDLVYQHQERYYIVDYKSNHLGEHPAHYSAAAMTRAMDDHHYWLQAAIYQLALHRLLKNRLPGYQPAQHLGSVEYYFIRAAAPDGAHGHLAIDIAPDWLLQLDEYLLP